MLDHSGHVGRNDSATRYTLPEDTSVFLGRRQLYQGCFSDCYKVEAVSLGGMPDSAVPRADVGLACARVTVSIYSAVDSLSPLLTRWCFELFERNMKAM